MSAGGYIKGGFRRGGRRNKGLTMRKTLRQTLEENQMQSDFLSDLMGNPRRENKMLQELGPKKERTPKKEKEFKLVSPPQPLESDIQKAIITYLLKHPKIGLVERINSGAASGEDAQGNKTFVRFHKIYAHNLRKVDLECTLKGPHIGGKRLVIEVKRPPWTKPRDQREREQENYINHVYSLGGYGLFACSLEQVICYLDKI